MANDIFSGTGDWNDAADWSTGAEPGSGDTAEIAAGAHVTMTVGTGDTINSLTLDSGAQVNILGTLTVSGGTMNSSSGTLNLGNGTNIGKLFADGVTSATGTVNLNGYGEYTWAAGSANSTQTINMQGSDNTFQSSTPFGGTVANFATTDLINVVDGGSTALYNAHTIGTNSVTIGFTDGYSATINLSGPVTYNSSNISINSQNNVVAINTTAVVCFASGTLIRTSRGEVAVEQLQVGDLAITTSGRQRPIRWLGHRTLNKHNVSNFEAAWPIRVSAGAFGEGLPVSDLFLSPAHAVCVSVLEEIFIPIGALVNHTTIVPVEVDEVTYWHVELASHDVIYANGLPAESYLDCGNRHWFAGGDRSPDPVVGTSAATRYARPLVQEGLLRDAIYNRLRARAEALGWGISHDPDMYLLVDGKRVDADIEGDLARFLFPSSAQEVSLISRSFVPAHWQVGGDGRNLGLHVLGIQISDGLRHDEQISLDHLLLIEDFHQNEAEAGVAWRWTKGQLRLPEVLWQDCRTHVLVRIQFSPVAGEYIINHLVEEGKTSQGNSTDQTDSFGLRLVG